ncbi:Ppx/GppA phosphatase family protein [Geodermatophilus sabuli]|uniref:Ppx/GppA phosphatase n=1 Tax=Geodermatophilus sabuli TaxID=1564158 RepID=A0A285E926_9ACTN|nr:Ppx/GppA phosphatase family protein [Geodermatophilus sabuli]MBB3085010.1 exopolyphosphatase/guanosine-5'-triphosphate,3'-diphosphate pyrophosphatase [Geodermatophilus sabuli]SNX95582.1 Ppx/GppA phosphatase [Geodermatophilus sabuli]
MRLGVLDVGSNTVHLLVVDAHRGAHPTPMHDDRAVLRLAEHVGPDDVLSTEGEKALVEAVRRACDQAAEQGCEELLALVTSAIREARNGLEVLERVRQRTGVELQVTSGEEEARLTFLAVRRWFGWSAGRLLVLDIGGGSLELASGVDEDPDVALSLPLGAGRMTRHHLPDALRGGRPDLAALERLDAYATDLLAPAAKELLAGGPPDLVAATSKTFRTLARLTGAAPYSAGLQVPRQLTQDGLGQLIGFVSRIESSALAELRGVSPDRAHQVPAGAVVARAAMRELDVPSVRICPWALREGVILRRLDWLGEEQ